MRGGRAESDRIRHSIQMWMGNWHLLGSLARDVFSRAKSRTLSAGLHTTMRAWASPRAPSRPSSGRAWYARHVRSTVSRTPVRARASSESSPSSRSSSNANVDAPTTFEAYCLESLGMTDADVAKILAHTPKLKGYDVSSVVHPKVAFLRDELGAPADKLRAAIKREPRLLVVGLPSLVVTAEYFRDEIGVPKNKLGAMLCKQPSLAWASVPEKLRPVVAFLGDELGMSPAAVADVASRHPSVLQMSVHDTLRAKARFYADAFCLTDAQTCAMLAKHPKLLCLSVDAAVRPKLAYLATTLGLGRGGATRLAASAPAILSLSLERNIVPTVQFLAEELELGVEGAARCVAQRPMILAYSVERKLRPTVEYLTAEFFPRCDVKTAVSLSSYSLRSRIVPRVRVLRKRGLMAAAVSGEGAEGGANFSPAYVVCMRDDKFRQLAGIDADAYREEVRAAEEEKIPTLGPLTDGRRRDGEGTGAR